MKNILILLLALLPLSAFGQTKALSVNSSGVVVNTNALVQWPMPLVLPNGLVGVPSLAFVGNTDMGFFRNGNNQLGVAVAGILSARFLSSGQMTLDNDSAYLSFGVNGEVAINRPAANTLNINGNLTVATNLAALSLRVTNDIVARAGIQIGAGYATPGATMDWIGVGSTTVNIGSISAGADATVTISVPGAGTNDVVAVGIESAVAALHIGLTHAVSATNTVTIYLHNFNTISSIDPDNAVYRARVTRIH